VTLLVGAYSTNRTPWPLGVDELDPAGTILHHCAFRRQVRTQTQPIHERSSSEAPLLSPSRGFFMVGFGRRSFYLATRLPVGLGKMR
jgi:hypothetical protein